MTFDFRRAAQLHSLTGLPPIEFGKEAIERIRGAVWPETPYPQKLPWRVPPAWVEQWATKWAKYYQETKHERQRTDRAEAAAPEGAAET